MKHKSDGPMKGNKFNLVLDLFFPFSFLFSLSSPLAFLLSLSPSPFCKYFRFFTNASFLCPLYSIIPMFDPPRPDTKEVIEKVGKYGISVKMITGDQLAIARETCRSLGILNPTTRFIMS